MRGALLLVALALALPGCVWIGGSGASGWESYSAFRAWADYRESWNATRTRAGLEATGLPQFGSTLASGNGTMVLAARADPGVSWQLMVSMQTQWPAARSEGYAYVSVFESASGYRHTGDVRFEPTS
jgi:hypothetical protein